MESQSTKILGQDSIHRLCAGQVIVSLESTVKELLENALDARATSIEIHLTDYGVERLSVADNGIGIRKSDHCHLGQRNATSKLQSFSELRQVQFNNFGFRGEAIHSLATLSKALIISTKHRDEDLGWRLEWQSSSQTMKSSPMAKLDGTTVVVEGLFSHLPVRRIEFAKHAQREIPKLLQLLHQFCLSYTHIGLSLSNIATKSNCRDLLPILFTPKTSSTLLEFSFSVEPGQLPDGYDDLKFDGFIGNPFSSSAGADGSFEGKKVQTKREFVYLERHPCYFPAFTKAIYRVYKDLNGSSIKPFILLRITVNPSAENIDKNVTPDKRTILLSQQDLVIGIFVEKLVHFLKTTADRQDTPVLHSQSLDLKPTLLKQYFQPDPSTSLTFLPEPPSPASLPAPLVDLEGTVDSASIQKTPSTPAAFPSSITTDDAVKELLMRSRSKPSLSWDTQSSSVPSTARSNCSIASSSDYSVPAKSTMSSSVVDEAMPVSVDTFTLSLRKQDFLKMQPLGQFNNGFIIALLRSESSNPPAGNLFILDQHACDEKYRFEDFKKNMLLKSKIRDKNPQNNGLDDDSYESKSQKLLFPLKLKSLSQFELQLLQVYEGTLRAFGFQFEYKKLEAINSDGQAPQGESDAALNDHLSVFWTHRPRLAESLCIDEQDLLEILYSIHENPAQSTLNFSKSDAVCASKACRSAVMIGTPLSMKEMIKIVRNLAGLEQPWNCPHGRPTIRHLWSFH